MHDKYRVRKGSNDDDFPDDGFIRIVERGQLADTINVWSDLGRTGRYFGAQGHDITELISFTGGLPAASISMSGLRTDRERSP